MSKKKKIVLIVLAVAIPLILAGGLFAALFPMGISMVFGTHFSHSLQADIKVVRESLLLSEFPPSAAEFHRQDWSNLFSGGVYMKFSAPAEEITEFLDESDGLAGVQPSHLTRDDMVYGYFEGLSWFDPSPDMSYVYEAEAEGGFGYVIHDRENGTIYLMFTW